MSQEKITPVVTGNSVIKIDDIKKPGTATPVMTPVAKTPTPIAEVKEDMGLRYKLPAKVATSVFMKPQKDLKEYLHRHLQGLNYAPVSEDGFIYAEGEVPVLLVAHMDTVHTKSPSVICKGGKDGEVWMSPDGIGGDDRAGVYIALSIIRHLRCHVLFCEDEEIGGVGARKFTSSGINIPGLLHIIEFDRVGSNDAVFYQCDNKEYAALVEEYGFRTATGSFSDISTVAPHLGIAAVNLSAGYFNPHMKYEYVDFSIVHRNIARAIRLIDDSVRSGKVYKYVKKEYSYSKSYNSNYGSGYRSNYGSNRSGVQHYGSNYRGNRYSGYYDRDDYGGGYNTRRTIPANTHQTQVTQVTQPTSQQIKRTPFITRSTQEIPEKVGEYFDSIKLLGTDMQYITSPYLTNDELVEKEAFKTKPAGVTEIYSDKEMKKAESDAMYTDDGMNPNTPQQLSMIPSHSLDFDIDDNAEPWYNRGIGRGNSGTSMIAEDDETVDYHNGGGSSGKSGEFRDIYGLFEGLGKYSRAQQMDSVELKALCLLEDDQYIVTRNGAMLDNTEYLFMYDGNGDVYLMDDRIVLGAEGAHVDASLMSSTVLQTQAMRFNPLKAELFSVSKLYTD